MRSLKFLGTGLAVLVGAGSVVMAAVPAEAAAAKKCYVGTWKLTAAKGLNVGSEPNGTYRSAWSGGVGTRLTIGTRTLSYDFTKAGRELRKERFENDAYEGYNVYKKKLKVGVKFTGNRKGAYAIAERSATGTATVRLYVVKPVKLTYKAHSLAKEVRDGLLFDSPVIVEGSYTCSAGKLTVKQLRKGSADGYTWNWRLTQTYRRA